jgi:flagellar hook-associated protein 2
MASAIDGLISGLQTTDLINSLMRVEAAPQTLLKAKVTTTNSLVTALQALNSKVSSLSASALTASKPASWQAVAATSSSTAVTATASAGAQPASLTFSVDKLASAQTSVSASVTDLAGFFGGSTPTSATIVTGSGAEAKHVTIDLASVTDLAGFASAINAAGSGVSATVVKTSATESRLQLTGSATGAVGAFDLYSGTVTATDLATLPAPTAVVARGSAMTDASDAQITLWPGSGAGNEQAVTSSSNTFAGVVTGLSFTVGATTAADAPATVTVKRDNAALKALASGLVANLTTVLSEIDSQTKATTKTVDGRSVITGGVLSGQSGVRMLQNSVLAAASAPINGISPSTLGIVLGKDGTITYDDALFTAALAADPAKVQAVVSGIAERLATVAKAQSDPASGQLTLKIQGQQSYSKTLSEQVDNFDIRLALRRAALEKTYASLEVSLSNLNAQSSWLTSQIDQLSTNSSN